MTGEKLTEKKLRLSDQEIADVDRLRGDRGQNVCYRRAIQQWIKREEMLQEAMRLGHPIPAVHADGPIPVQTAAPPLDNGHENVTKMTRKNVPEAVPQPEPDVPEEDESVEGDEPPRRRPPTSAETWGSGGPQDAS